MDIPTLCNDKLSFIVTRLKKEKIWVNISLTLHLSLFNVDSIEQLLFRCELYETSKFLCLPFYPVPCYFSDCNFSQNISM